MKNQKILINVREYEIVLKPINNQENWAKQNFENQARDWAKKYLKKHAYAVKNCHFIQHHNSVYVLNPRRKEWEKARCSKQDTFVLEIGKAIALSRLLHEKIPDFI